VTEGAEARRFRLDLAYDGTDFEGWQMQTGPGHTKGPLQGRTVQGELEAVLSRVVKAPVAVVGAGRTDAGVHARGQTAHFDAVTRMDGGQFLKALNSLLPRDIRVTACRETESAFHARFSALARVYRYHVVAAQTLLPWEVRYCHRVDTLPSLPVLNAMAARLYGELDFTAFAHAQETGSKSRFIYHASFFPQGDHIVFQIAGNAFLWRMVRSLVGTMLEFGAKGKGADEFGAVLASRDRARAGATAPGNGLFLHKVIYDEREFSF
jgi:tRNA pseudouridine38-40 synthase